MKMGVLSFSAVAVPAVVAVEAREEKPPLVPCASGVAPPMTAASRVIERGATEDRSRLPGRVVVAAE